MINKLECPSPGVLAELIQGRKVEPELSELSQHLEQCSACQEKARALAPDDALVQSLRGEAPAEDKIARGAPRPLIEKLKQIPRRDLRGAVDAFELYQDTVAAPEELVLGFLAPAQAADEIGRLGHYRVLKVLGSGGMGLVLLADDPKLERRVALKVMLPRLAANPTAKERFLREARAAARVKSDYIVTIHYVGEFRGVPYLAMELLEGQSLEEIFRAGQPLPVARIVTIARDIARGLAAAHEKGLIHRDIKPGNLWIEGEPGASALQGRVKILDFGLARADQENAQITQSGAVLGTPAYMAPEQARGDKAVDGRADLFSLGCVLYHLCTGRAPFRAETTMGTLLAVALNQPDHPVRLNANADIPTALSQLIMQLLEKDPNRRPRSARDVIARLEEIQAAHADGKPLTPRVRSVRGSESSVRGLAIAGLLVAALVVCAGAVILWQTPDGSVVRIECDDPSINIAFGTGEFKVAGAYKEPLSFKPGKVGLRVARKGQEGDDFEFETDKFIVSKGDQIVLRIEAVAGKVQIVQAGKGVLDSRDVPVTPRSVVADVERKAAEWVLAIGGVVRVNNGDRSIEAAAELPATPFTLTTVHLTRTAATDAGLANLKDLKELMNLRLDHTEVTDAGLVNFKNHKALKNLLLTGPGITDAGLAYFKDCKGLMRIYLERTKVTNAGLIHLKGLEGLTQLTLIGAKVNDAGLVHLTGLQGLTYLKVLNTKITTQGLQRFHAAVPTCRIEHDGGTIAAKE